MNSKPIPEIILERFVLDELDEKRKREIEGMMAADGDLRRRVEALRESGSEILMQYPAEKIVPFIVEKSGQRSGSERSMVSGKKPAAGFELFTKRLAPALAFVTIAAAVTFYALTYFHPAVTDRTTGVSDITRAKGLVPGLYLYRKKGDSAEMLSTGTLARERDLVQIAYMAADHDHGVIFSVDGNGSVTLQYPDRAGQSTSIPAGKKVFLRSSYELDNAPGFEKFFFITSSHEIDVDTVLRMAQKNAREAGSDRADFTRAGSGERQYVFTLKKRD